MVTLLPALLVICGRWVFWPKRPTFGSAEPTATGFWARVGQRIALRPAQGLGGHGPGPRLVACLGLFKLDTSGLNTDDQYTKEFDSSRASSCSSTTGMVDTSNPLQVVANEDQADSRWPTRWPTVAGIGEVNDRDPGRRRRRAHHGRRVGRRRRPSRPSTW